MLASSHKLAAHRVLTVFEVLLHQSGAGWTVEVAVSPARAQRRRRSHAAGGGTCGERSEFREKFTRLPRNSAWRETKIFAENPTKFAHSSGAERRSKKGFGWNRR